MSSQFRHKQPTRFNEPEIPQDLATKGYVDAQQTISNQFFITWSTTEPIQAHNNQFMWIGISTATGNRSNRSSLMTLPLIWQIINCRVDTNANTDTCGLTFEVQQSTTALLLTIPTLATGVFTGTATVNTVADDECVLIVVVGSDTVNTCRVRGISMSGIYP